MSDGTCLLCGGALPSLTYRGNPRKWCSESCLNRAARLRAKERGTRYYARCAIRVSTCEICGRLWSGRRGSKVPRTCPARECVLALKARMAREKYHAQQVRGRSAVGSCLDCGVPVKGGSTGLCRSCAVRRPDAAQQRLAAAILAARAVRLRPIVRFLERVSKPTLELSVGPRGRMSLHMGRQPSALQVLVAGPCANCGVSFVGVGKQARYCSESCTKRAANRRKTERSGGFVVSDARRWAIYARDQHTCQLCFKPVDITLSSYDRWSATLDHIECQSWVLVPDHSDSNLRLAHRYCNAVRNDESNPRWLALIA